MNPKSLISTATSALLCALFLACGAKNESSTSTTGSQTNWLEPCKSDTECSGLRDAVCEQNICTRRCVEDSKCEALSSAASCQRVDDADTYKVCMPKCSGPHCSAPEPPPEVTGTQPTDSSPETDVREAGAPTATQTEPNQTRGDGGCVEPPMEVTLDGATQPDCTDGGCGQTTTVITSDGSTTSSDENCVGPENNPEQAYQCILSACPCAADAGDPVTCVEPTAEGVRYGFACVDGVWTIQAHDACATTLDQCFSPDQNVALSLTGTISGCACDDETDDFGACGIEGDARVPMTCSNGHWHAPFSCEGLEMDLCAF
jgi:hypothetical protein